MTHAHKFVIPAPDGSESVQVTCSGRGCSERREMFNSFTYQRMGGSPWRQLSVKQKAKREANVATAQGKAAT